MCFLELCVGVNGGDCGDDGGGGGSVVKCSEVFSVQCIVYM